MEMYWVAPGFFHQEHHAAQRLFRQGLVSNTLLFSSSMSKSPIMWFWSGQLSFEGPKVCVELCGNMVLFYFLFLRTLNMICRNEIWRRGQPTVEITPRRGSCWMWKGGRNGNCAVATVNSRAFIWGTVWRQRQVCWITTSSPETMCGASSAYIVLPAPEVFLGCADFWTNACALRKCLFTWGD